MAGINAFTDNPQVFGMNELTAYVQNMPTVPGMIGAMNLFTPKPVRQKDIWIDRKQGALSLIPFSDRGTSPNETARYSRDAVNFTIPRMAQQLKVHATEIAGLRASGSETELMAVQSELNTQLVEKRANISMTEEYLQLAAIQGKVLDPADGSEYYDYFTELGITPAASVSFALGTATTKVKQIAEELVIDIKRNAHGAWVQGQSRVVGLVGDAFWFALVQHANVEKYYQNWSAMAELKNINPSEEFTFGDITFKRYQGSDDNSTVAIDTNEAKFFVENGNNIFVKAMAPADEHIPYVGSLGQSLYIIPKKDVEYPDAPRWMGYDMLAYPLYMCQRPNTLRTGTRT